METLKPINTIEYQGYKIEIHIDDNPQSPRDDDNLGTMVCLHGKYNLGDKHDYNSQDFPNWQAIEAAIQKDTKGAIVLPLYMMDHSGLSISTTDVWFRAMDAQGWDWGQIGFVYVPKSKVREEHGVKTINRELTKSILDTLRLEVETYSHYVNGENYGFIVRDKTGNEVDSCWGYIGLNDYIIREARNFVDFEVANSATGAI